MLYSHLLPLNTKNCLIGSLELVGPYFQATAAPAMANRCLSCASMISPVVCARLKVAAVANFFSFMTLANGEPD